MGIKMNELHRLSMVDSHAHLTKVIEEARAWAVSYQQAPFTSEAVREDLEELIEILEEIRH